MQSGPLGNRGKTSSCQETQSQLPPERAKVLEKHNLRRHCEPKCASKLLMTHRTRRIQIQRFSYLASNNQVVGKPSKCRRTTSEPAKRSPGYSAARRRS